MLKDRLKQHGFSLGATASIAGLFTIMAIGQSCDNQKYQPKLKAENHIEQTIKEVMAEEADRHAGDCYESSTDLRKAPITNITEHEGYRTGSWGALTYLIDENNIPYSQGFHEIIPNNQGGYNAETGACEFKLNKSGHILNASNIICKKCYKESK